MVRGTGRVERHPACVFEMLSDLDNKKKWNPQFRTLDIIEEFDETLRVRMVGRLEIRSGCRKGKGLALRWFGCSDASRHAAQYEEHSLTHNIYK